MGYELYILGIIILAAIVFWLWILIDAIRRPKLPDKILWILVILFTSIIGAVVYYMLIRKVKK